MIFEKHLMPDALLGSFRDVTPEFCEKQNIRALICDIDNTLVTYDDPEPTTDVLAWFGLMKKAGVKIAFVSNNHPERVERFNRALGYPAYPDAGKPKTEFYEKAMRELGVEKSGCAVLGDQLLTDAWAAHNFGVFAVIVPPIRDKRTLFFRFKRFLERPYIKKFEKSGSK